MKKRTKRLVAAFAAMTMMLGTMPSMAWADENYTVYNGTTTVPEDAGITQGTAYINSKTASDLGYDAILTKSLVIEEDANIPQATFTYAISSPANTQNYTGNDSKYVYKTSDSNSTVSVFRGINADQIQVSIYDAGDDATSAVLTSTALTTDNSKGSKSDVTTDSSNTETFAALFNKTQTVTLVYNKQQVKRNDPTAPDGTTDTSKYIITDAGTALDDDVFIVDASDGASKTAYGYYTANKSMLLDFTKCAFSEPGIYRYIITEGGSNTGVTNDGVDERTLDVYVEHVDGTPNTLKVTGYVLYKDVVDEAPSATIVSAGTNVSVDGSSNVTANGAEVAGEEKSSGWLNTYTTSNLSIGKKVEGNQGSKDKYFKYIVTVEGITANDKFTVEISDAESFKSVIGTLDTNYPNSATMYTNTEIANGIAADATAAGGTLAGGNNLGSFDVTGTGVMVYEVFLKNGQYVTLTGLPVGAKYSITEAEEDYAQTIYGDIDETTDTGLGILKKYVGGTALAAAETTALEANTNAITEGTKIAVDAVNAEYAFKNYKNGVLPTGIIMSVAPAAFVGIGVLAVIIFMVIAGKRREAEEE